MVEVVGGVERQVGFVVLVGWGERREVQRAELYFIHNLTSNLENRGKTRGVSELCSLVWASEGALTFEPVLGLCDRFMKIFVHLI